jgi:anti-sigma B factor antagonist
MAMRAGDRLPQRFEVELSVDAGVVIVAARGEIDLASAPALVDGLTRAVSAYDGDILVDLCGVTFMDSSGLQAIADARRQVVAASRRLHVACPPEGPVGQVLNLTAMSALLSTRATRAEALAHLRS